MYTCLYVYAYAYSMNVYKRHIWIWVWMRGHTLKLRPHALNPPKPHAPETRVYSKVCITARSCRHVRPQTCKDIDDQAPTQSIIKFKK